MIICYLKRRNNRWVNDGRGGYDRVDHGLDDEEIEFKARMIDNVEVITVFFNNFINNIVY